jgi:hypothetical protein
MTATIRSAEIRYRVDPGDVPPEKAARRIGLTLARFHEVRAQLEARGFPQADPTTGNYDLEEIDRWRADRHCRRAQVDLTRTPPPASDRTVLSMGDRFSEAKKRRRHG